MKSLVLPNELLLGEVKRLLASGHEVVLMTRGCSMLPFIVGSRDSVRLVPSAGPSAGDIVLAEVQKDRYVLHRVLSVDGEEVTLKGDGNLVGTVKCSVKDVFGVARAIVGRKGRERECCSDRAKERARRWNALPYTVRRYTLAVLRRTIVRKYGI